MRFIVEHHYPGDVLRSAARKAAPVSSAFAFDLLLGPIQS